MTDEQMDARLREAGEAWRAASAGTMPPAHPGAAPLDVVAVARPRRRHRLALSVSAAALVAALGTAGGLLAANLGGHDTSTTTSGPSTSTPSALVGRTWLFSSIESERGNSSSGRGASGTGIVLTFNRQGGFRLDTACGRIAGDIKFGRGKLVFVWIHMDARANGCPTAEVNTTRVLFRFLHGTVGWTLDTAQLRLTNGHTTMTFDDSAPPPSTLAGKTWTAWQLEVDTPTSARSTSTPHYTFVIDATGTSARIIDPRGVAHELPIRITAHAILFGAALRAPANACRAEQEVVSLFHGRQPWLLDNGVLFLGDMNRTSVSLVQDDLVNDNSGNC